MCLRHHAAPRRRPAAARQRSRARLRGGIVAVAILQAAFGATGAASSQPPRARSMRDVLQRAASYVADFERTLAGIIAEEVYVQDAQIPGSTAAVQHVELRSQLMLLSPGGRNGWTQYRDVFEVNGQPVRDRGERLTALARSSSTLSREQLRRIIEESARYNIGDVMRNINTPLFPLQALRGDMQWRFKFSRASTPSLPGALPSGGDVPGAFRVSTEVWIVEFRETETPTWIRTPGNGNIKTHGRFWIEPDTGRVLMSELVADQRTVHATIDVSYQSEPVLGMLVPIEMRERYDGRASGSRTEARATYGRFQAIDDNTITSPKE